MRHASAIYVKLSVHAAVNMSENATWVWDLRQTLRDARAISSEYGFGECKPATEAKKWNKADRIDGYSANQIAGIQM